MPPSTFGDDPLLWIANNLVELGVAAAILLAQIWVFWLIWREILIRKVKKSLPADQRQGIGSTARRVGIFTRTHAPKDPYDLRTAVVIQPLGDGRPGEGFLAPGPAKPPGEVGDLDGRMDATVALAEGMWMLVYCSGRVGAQLDDFVVLPAAERVHAAREKKREGISLLGPVDPVHSRAGDGWRTTMTYPSGKALTDTHIDHEGWAYIIGVLSSSHHARAVEVLDAILATWKWLPDRGSSVQGWGLPAPDEVSG